MSSAPPPQTFEQPPSGPSSAPRGAQERAPLPLWTAPAAVALGLCGGIFASIFVTLIGSAFGSSTVDPTPAVSLLSSLVFDLAFVAAALYFTALRRRPRAVDFGYRRTPWGTAASAFVVGGVLYYVVSYGYGALLNIHGNDKLPSSFGVHTSTAAMLGTAAFVCVVAPICEELFFRGFLFGVLCQIRITLGGRSAGPLAAAVITGILFGLAHTGSVSSSQYLIPLGFLGFVLCLVRWRTGSLYPCMALHSFNNALAFGVLLDWSGPEVIALLIASWAAIAVLTGPLAGPKLETLASADPAR
ncbi:MAG: lysostaphin resistance A-like protein [Solirubrobacteraceae bacterium]